MKNRLAIVAFGIAISMSVAARAEAPMAAAQTVHFALGTRSVHYDSTVERTPRDYVLHASRGQTLRIDLDGQSSTHFDILTPQNPTALYNGAHHGHHAVLAVPTEGQYIVRVYQDVELTAATPFQLGITISGSPAHRTAPPSMVMERALRSAAALL